MILEIYAAFLKLLFAIDNISAVQVQKGWQIGNLPILL